VYASYLTAFQTTVFPHENGGTMPNILYDVFSVVNTDFSKYEVQIYNSCKSPDSLTVLPPVCYHNGKANMILQRRQPHV